MASKRRPMPITPRRGRRENPLTGPPGCPIVAIAEALRALRDDNDRPPYSRMAKRVHVCGTALSKAASGRKQPTWAVVREYVLACGGDVDRYKHLYLTLFGELR
jgi:hypothetical protein